MKEPLQKKTLIKMSLTSLTGIQSNLGHGRDRVETDNNEKWLWAALSKIPLESSLSVYMYVSKHRMDGICGYDGKSWQKYNSDNRGSGNFWTIANILS
jgi:hypothetical protein